MIEMLQTELETTIAIDGESKVANINSSYVSAVASHLDTFA